MLALLERLCYHLLECLGKDRIVIFQIQQVAGNPVVIY